MMMYPIDETPLSAGLAGANPSPGETSCGSILTRRQLLGRLGLGMGSVVMSDLLTGDRVFGLEPASGSGLLHFAPRAKRMIFLFQSGAPAQQDLFDYKPLLNQQNGEDLPESVRQGQRLTSQTAGQARFPLAGTQFKFEQHGASGAWVSDVLPYTARIADDLCFVKSLSTDAINHDPAITFVQTGSQLSGRPSLGAWLSYGLGSASENLPVFVTMITRDQGGQPVYSRLWGSGFLPATHQGVRFRSGKDPILFLNNPPGVSRDGRRLQLDRLRRLHEMAVLESSDRLIESRIAQYELAFRMQTSVPEVTDLSDETEATFAAYGPDSRKPGSYAANCILARRLAERGVRCIQLFHRGWDHHNDLPKMLRDQCRETDQPSAALVQDLKDRGLLDDTLVIWGGEFGRTSYCQGKLTQDNYGRDHHPRCFTMWLAGGGVKAGMSHGETDDFGYSVVKDPVTIHDLQATILRLFGIDHERLTYKYQGRRFRVTDVHGRVVDDILA